jgi:hypothetical protein
MKKAIRHFGCIVRNVPEASLARYNYAVINDASRKNSFMHDKSYIGLSYTEANEKRISCIEKVIRNELEKYVAFYKKATSSDSDLILNNYISNCKQDVIKNQKESFAFENTLSKIQFENLAYGRKLHSKCKDDAKKAWLECVEKIKEIDKYTINDVLEHTSKPKVLSEWQSINGISSINVSNEFIRNYIVENYKMPYHNDKWCKEQREKALKNFDLNMLFFEMLDKEKFNCEIDCFLKKHNEFQKVEDLNDYKGVSGIYIMILDEYKQIYIGITEKGLKERIQEHWTRKMPLDRLLFGSVHDSKISIDSFGHFDTTRIYVYPCNGKTSLLSKEFYLIENSFSPDFICNRCSGGGETMIEAIAFRKTRNLKLL